MKKKSYWRITLINGKVIDDRRVYNCHPYEDYFKFCEVAVRTETVKIRQFLRRAIEAKQQNKYFNTLYIIPMANILKIEKRECGGK